MNARRVGQSGGQSNKKMAIMLGGLMLVGFSYPFWMVARGTGVDYDKPLAGQTKIRGVYMNSGSKDAGRDLAAQEHLPPKRQ